MATHLCAWSEVLPTDIETEMDVIPDDVLTRTANERFMVPAEIPNVIWKAALSTNLSTARIYTPSLEVKRTVPYVIPQVYNASFFPPERLAVDKELRPLALVATEEISFYATTYANVRAWGLVSLGPPTLPPAPAGDIRVVRATGTKTLTANQWTSVKIVPDVALEAGTYALIGFLPISDNCIAARAIISGQVWRPGVTGFAGAEYAAKLFERSYFTELQNYNMGTFTHMTIPEFQFLSSAADTAQVVYLYIVKTA